MGEIPRAWAAHLARPARMALLARTPVASASRTAARRSVPLRQQVVVRADAAATPAPAAAKKAEKAPWVMPTLNTETPSPIFGGSTGGLLRKAQASWRVQAAAIGQLNAPRRHQPEPWGASAGVAGRRLQSRPWTSSPA